MSSTYNRRRFLTLAAAASTGYLLAGCNPNASAAQLRVDLLRGAIPSQLLNAFRQQLDTPAQIDFLQETQPHALFQRLQQWQRAPREAAAPSGVPSWVPFVGASPAAQPTDLLSLGDFWLQKAIQQKLIQPLPAASLRSLEPLLAQPHWRSLLQRNDQGQPAAQGQFWGLPYRWGTLLMAYRRDLVAQAGVAPPTDWSDLWQPAWRRHFSVLDQGRIVVGLALKQLGQSFNTADLAAVPDLTAQLDALHQNVLLYSSDGYLEPLLLGDTWLAVGWSTDLLPLVRRSRHIELVVPPSGTVLWADLWVQPTGTGAALSPVAQAWLDFFGQPTTGQQLSVLSTAASPVLLTQPRDRWPQSLQTTTAKVPDPAIVAKSEFLLPLPAAAIAQYQAQWERLRQPS